MNIKKIVRIATAPVWIPLWPIVTTAKRLYRTHDNKKELFCQWKGRKPHALDSISRKPESGGVSFREAIAVAEQKAQARGKSYSVAGVRKWFLWRKRMILAGAYPMFLLGLLTCWTNSFGWPTWCGPGLMFMALQLALQAVPAQFRIWQIDNQRLSADEKGGFDDFRRECRWFLDSIDPEIRLRSGHIASAMLCAVLLLPAVSHADAISDITSTTTADDLSMKGLVSMFGQIVNDPLNAAIGDGGDTLVSQVIKVFCSSLLIVATAVAGYQAQNSSSSAGMLTAKSTYKANEMSGTDGVVDYVFHTMFQDLTTWSTGLAADENGIVNPLIAMKNFGDRLLTTSEVGIAAFAGLQALSQAADSSLLGKVANFVGLKALTGFIDSIAWFVKIVLIALLGFGITLSVYLPMLPFIIWLMACVNYLIIIGEAIFAAPLWAFSHLLSDGEGMGHKTSHGYLFLINLAFRPILMVGGFLLGGTAVFVGGMLLNTLFETAVANGHSSSIVGVATFVGTLAVYCSLSLGLVSTSFSLTNIVPDGVISWIGGHSGAVLGRDTHDKSQSSVDRMGGKAENITGQATGAGIAKGSSLPGGKSSEGNSIK